MCKFKKGDHVIFKDKELTIYKPCTGTYETQYIVKDKNGYILNTVINESALYAVKKDI